MVCGLKHDAVRAKDTNTVHKYVPDPNLVAWTHLDSFAYRNVQDLVRNHWNIDI